MDIEKLKKVNQLATTLRSQGLAAGRDDAAELAGKMNWEQEDNVDHIFGEEEKEQAVLNEPQQEEPKQEQNPGMDEQKIYDILQKFADQFSEEINKLNNKVNEQDEIIKQLSQRIVQMNEQESTQKTNSSATEQKQTQLNAKQEKAENSEEQPRSGDYGSSDVCIEKFFYYGQK